MRSGYHQRPAASLRRYPTCRESQSPLGRMHALHEEVARHGAELSFCRNPPSESDPCGRSSRPSRGSWTRSPGTAGYSVRSGDSTGRPCAKGPRRNKFVIWRPAWESGLSGAIEREPEHTGQYLRILAIEQRSRMAPGWDAKVGSCFCAGPNLRIRQALHASRAGAVRRPGSPAPVSADPTCGTASPRRLTAPPARRSPRPARR